MMFRWMIFFLLSTVFSLGNESLKELDSYLLPGARFYSVTTADIDGDGSLEVLTAGQLTNDKGQQGYLSILNWRDGRLAPRLDQAFVIDYEKKRLPTRVRTILLLKAVPEGWDIFLAGKAGTDDSGIGFLRRYRLVGDRLKHLETLTFHDPDTHYTHGYPLAAGNVIEGERPEVIYGGFSGQNDIDRADVRVFRLDNVATLTEWSTYPFAELKKPLRVNALYVGDLGRDHLDDILIAGRTSDGTRERAALAWWTSNGAGYFQDDGKDTSRFRCLELMDLDRNGGPEIITGGRVLAGSHKTAQLDIWPPADDSLELLGRYRWTGPGDTRLRVVCPQPAADWLIVAGRTQALRKGRLRWVGFVQPFVFTDQVLMPAGPMQIIHKGRETRIRDLASTADNRLFAAGFTVDKNKRSSGLMMVLSSD